MVFEPGERFLIVLDDNVARRWEITTGQEVSKVTLNNGLAAAFSADGQWLAKLNRDGIVQVHHLANGNVKEVKLEKNLQADYLAISCDGNLLAMSSMETVFIWELKWEAGHIDLLALNCRCWMNNPLSCFIF